MIGGMFWDFAWRLLLAGVLGAVIGLDREYRAKEAGFRTHFLVALGSALFMIVSQYGFSGVLAGADVKLDPSRVAAQVVSGIGFLGAGTIIFQKQVVRGLTTAAGLWATAGIGLAVGGGMYWVSVCATVLKRRDSQRAVRVFHRLARGAEEDFRRGTPAGASRNQLHDPGRGARRTYALSGHAGGPHPQAERRAIVVRVYPVVAGHDAGIDGVGCSFGANGRRFCLRALRENSAGKSAGEFRTAVGIRSSDECGTCRSPLSVQSVLLTIVYESLDRAVSRPPQASSRLGRAGNIQIYRAGIARDRRFHRSRQLGVESGRRGRVRLRAAVDGHAVDGHADRIAA